MLDNKRIQEAKSNMKNYLSEGLIKKEGFRQLVFDTYLRNHYESLNLAEHVYNSKLSNLWTVVISYYSMFYIANVVLYKSGFKVGGRLAHKVTADALIELVRKKLKDSLLDDYEAAKEEVQEITQQKADVIIGSFDKERSKRSIFQYETTEEIKNSKANTSLLRARQFSVEMEKLV